MHKAVLDFWILHSETCGEAAVIPKARGSVLVQRCSSCAAEMSVLLSDGDKDQLRTLVDDDQAFIAARRSALRRVIQ